MILQLRPNDISQKTEQDGSSDPDMAGNNLAALQDMMAKLNKLSAHFPAQSDGNSCTKMARAKYV